MISILVDLFFLLVVVKLERQVTPKMLIRAYITHPCAKTLIHYAACTLAQTTPLASPAS